MKCLRIWTIGHMSLFCESRSCRKTRKISCVQILGVLHYLATIVIGTTLDFFLGMHESFSIYR